MPIESVAAVVECKSTDSGMRNEEKGSILKDWCNSIKHLRTSNRSISRMAMGMVINGIPSSTKGISRSTQTSTRPIRVFCGFETKGKKDEILDLFDFVLIASEEQKKIDVLFNGESNLGEWYEQLNHHEFVGNERMEKVTGDIVGLNDKTFEDFKVQNEGKEISLLSFNF